ncbi:MAG: hypothetical protein HC862_19055 [Scytonema sp. RU_4_4]|nr:hypothetical protein [Scytonema sp. RU_4_4]
MKVAQSKNNKKLVAVLVFTISLVADLIIPGLGIAIDFLFLLWELMEPEEIEGEDSEEL